MKFSAVFAAATLAVAVQAGSNATFTTTEIVNEYVTYCPTPTEVVEKGKTYTVTKPTTLTITHCPGGCTRTKTYTTVSVTKCAHGCPGAPTSAPVYPNATVVVPTVKPTGAGNTTVPQPTVPSFTGAASRTTVAGGALAGLVGLVAYLL